MDTMRRMTVGTALLLLALASGGPAGAATLGMVADNATMSVTVFDADSDTIVGTVDLPNVPASIGDCVVTADQKLGFVTDFNSHVWVIDLAASPPRLAGGVNPIPISNPGEDLAFSPDERFLVACDGFSSLDLSLIDVAARREVLAFAPGRGCNSVDVCADGSVLVTIPALFPNDATLLRFKLEAAGGLTDTGEVLAVNDPNNVFCAPGAETGLVIGRQLRQIRSFSVPGLHPADSRTLSGGDTGIAGALSPSGDAVYARSNGGAVDAFDYDPATGDFGAPPFFTFPVTDAQTFYGVDQIALDPEGEKLYVPSGPRVEIRDARTGALLGALTGPRLVRPSGVCLPALTAIAVRVDVKPGAFPNSVNPRSNGVLTVAILTTPDFDAARVDPGTVALGPDGAGIVHRARLADVDGDRDLDLVLQFRTPQTGIRCGDTSVALAGKTFDGRQIAGQDSIRTVGCK